MEQITLIAYVSVNADVHLTQFVLTDFNKLKKISKHFPMISKSIPDLANKLLRLINLESNLRICIEFSTVPDYNCIIIQKTDNSVNGKGNYILGRRPFQEAEKAEFLNVFTLKQRAF